MTSKALRFSLLLFLVCLIAAPPCLAKAKGYLFVVGYSFAHKKVFLSRVMMQKVRNVSYSNEEYVTEVVLLQKMESQFQSFLTSSEGVKTSDYTVSVRGAFKSEAIAKKRLAEEKERYESRGYTSKVLNNFVFND